MNTPSPLIVLGLLAVALLRVLSLAVLLVLFWYIMVTPSLQLKQEVKDNKLQVTLVPRDSAKKQEAEKELAKFDLEKKVYPEIQDRLTKVNEWFITKIVFAGALLGAFLLQVWWPFWSKDGSMKQRRECASDIFYDLLKSPQVCAVLGIACIVSLFMDLEIRRSLIVIHQLAVYTAEYAAPVLGGNINGFPAWEQFIRMPGPDTPGMHNSLIDAIQIGNLGVMTLLLFAFYHWTFQKAFCRQKLDEFNRLIYWLFIGALFIFLLSAHTVSGNFEFNDYGCCKPQHCGWLFSCFCDYMGKVIEVISYKWGEDCKRCWSLFSSFEYYLIAWVVFSIILVLWDVILYIFGPKKEKSAEMKSDIIIIPTAICGLRRRERKPPAEG